MNRLLSLIAFLVFSHTHFSFAENIVTNGDFEIETQTDNRPAYWYIGFKNVSETYADQGGWSLDDQIKSNGEQSLKCWSMSPDGYVITQILNAATYDLANKTVNISADIRHEGTVTPPGILVVALNPELPADSIIGTGTSGYTWITADQAAGSFHHYESQFTATDEASMLAAVLLVNGNSGTVWFDNVHVDVPIPTPGPNPPDQISPIQSRGFKLGFTQENPANASELAMENLMSKVSTAAEVVNLFAHIRWCGFTGESISWGHRHLLHQAELARQAGLQTALTFDFTHNSPFGIGDINPTPDGTIVGTLDDNAVVQAYQQELFELCRLIHPAYVVVGIEMDLFYDRHPEQWEAYVRMFKQVSDTLTNRNPGIHVTAYFTLPWLVDEDGDINKQHADAWRLLLPELQSVGYSVYPGTFSLDINTIPAGYFTKAAEIAPGLPLVLPEFGIPGGPSAPVSEQQQQQLLTRIFTEFETADVELACWYSLYDQTYLGTPDWFRAAFTNIGMHRLDSTPKDTWALWNAVYQTAKTTMRENTNYATKRFQLLQNYPNPFNSNTTIQYSIPFQDPITIHVVVTIYNLRGQLVRTLVNDWQRAGQYTTVWDGTNDYGRSVSSGLYLYRLQLGEQLLQRKLCFLK